MRQFIIYVAFYTLIMTIPTLFMLIELAQETV